MASAVAIDIYENKDIGRLRKVNDKLLYLLNKYRFAYLKSLELILFYEKILKRNYDKEEEPHLCDSLKKKRQNVSYVLDEEQFLRKRFKTDTLREVSVEILPYKRESSLGNATKNSNSLPKKNFITEDLEVEQNKADYVNLDALDFSAYVEDSEGCVKYCGKKNEIEKEKTNAQKKMVKESETLKSTYNSSNLTKKTPLTTQSKYGNPSLKSSYSKTLLSTQKSIQHDKQSKMSNIPLNPNVMNKSTYQRSFSKLPDNDKKGTIRNNPSDRKDINKSVYVPNTTNRQMPNANRSIYIGHKQMSNKINNLSDSMYVGSKLVANKYNSNIGDNPLSCNFNKNPIKQKINENVKKISPLNRPNNQQHSIYNKNPKMSNANNHSVYISKQMLNKNIGRENSSTINFNLKGRTTPNEVKNEPVGEKMKMENNISSLGRNNASVTTQEKNILKKNIEKENKEQILEEIQVKMENEDDETNVQKQKQKKKDFTEIELGTFLPLTMNYIDGLIENDEKNATGEKGQHTIEYIMVLKNEEERKVDKKSKESTACSLYNITEEEYKWIVEYREKKTKPSFQKQNRDTMLDPLNKTSDQDTDKKGKEEINENERLKGMQMNECKFFPEKEVVRNFRMGGSSAFGKMKCPISESNYKGNLGNVKISTESRISGDDVSVQTQKEKETHENTMYVLQDGERKKEDQTNRLNVGGNNNEQFGDFRNVIRNINQEIIQKSNQENTLKKEKTEVSNEEHSGINESETVDSGTNSSVSRNVKCNFKNTSFPSSLKRRALLNEEKHVTKAPQNNRANLYIELNTKYEFMSLDIIDLDKVIKEGLLSYKNVEESYIECSANTKDMIVYNEIIKTEKKTFHFSIEQAERNLKKIRQTEVEVSFKSGDEIKKEILKVVGVSVFQNINVTLHPTTSLINDEQLVLWFTKKKKEKTDTHRNFIESDSSQSTLFKKTHKRLSNMGIFCQPIIIMLSSLKRQRANTTLKKIIKSLILCSCDSSSMEKIVHVIPEENSKNYSQWKESLHNLNMFLGDKKSAILKKLVEFHGENSDDESADDESDWMQRKQERGHLNESFNEFDIHNRNNLDPYHLKTYDYMKGRNGMDTCLNNSLSSSTTTTTTAATSVTQFNMNNDDDQYVDKQEENKSIYEDEEFSLFIGTIPNANKRFQYLLLVDNFNFIYVDLVTHIQNKLSSIELIINRHVQLKQLFCNVLFLCNWLNEPKHYKWFLWNDILKKIEKLHGYLENGKISRERNIMLLLAKHTGIIFTDKELNNLKKISKFHIKDLYEKCIDFINAYLELKNQLNHADLKKNCCISIDGINILPEDKFLEKVSIFVRDNYKKMLYIIWNLDMLIKKYVILIVWLGDIKPFYPLFSYMDAKNKIAYSHDLFVNMVLFFESYNKYVNIIKKKNEKDFLVEKRNLDNVQSAGVDHYSFSAHTFANVDDNMAVNIFNVRAEKTIPFFSLPTEIQEQNRGNMLNEMDENSSLSSEATKTQRNIIPVSSVLSLGEKEDTSKRRRSRIDRDKKCWEDDSLETKDGFISAFPELKKRKSLTNTINYACEIKRKSLETEQLNITRRKSSSSGTSVEFESSD